MGNASMLFAGVTVTVVALIGLLVSLWRGSWHGQWLCKSVASMGFVGTALAAGCWHSLYGTAVLIALCFGAIGDVLLLPNSRKTFLAGLVVFLCGHLAYAVAFGCRGADSLVVGGALLVAAFPASRVLRWLWPHLTDSMRAPVGCYIVVISAMTAMGIGTFFDAPCWKILCGALLFYLSDLAVARERFVKAALVNRLVGLPLYYSAQTLLALSTQS